MSRIVIDPITRIEGHLRIEVEVQNGQVTDAWSSATLYRGVENMLTGRDPLDAPDHHPSACAASAPMFICPARWKPSRTRIK